MAKKSKGIVGAFNSLPRLVKIILLLIPGVNWIVEMIVRWGMVIEHGSILNLIIAILTIPGVGIILGWIDLIWTILFGHLWLA